MLKNKKEVQEGMTDKQFKAHIEELKIIVEMAKDKEQIKKALDRIQSSLERTK